MVDYRNHEFGVLFVDDEEVILKMFDAYFTDYFNTYTALSAADAFEICKKNEIGIIVSDYNMENMNGVEFFAQIQEQFPGTKRIMLTGDMDVEVVKQAVNKGHIHKFYHKPIEVDNFRDILFDQAEIYISDSEIKRKQKEYEADANAFREVNYQRNSLIFDTLLHLKHSGYEGFDIKLLDVFQKLFSLSNLTLNKFLDNDADLEFFRLRNMIRDAELIAEEFHIPYIKIVAQLIISDLELLKSNYSIAVKTYNNARRNLFGSESEEEEKLKQFCDSSLLSEFDPDLFNLENQRNRIINHIEDLLKIDMRPITNYEFSDIKLATTSLTSNLAYVFIIKDSVTVYREEISVKTKINPVLIGNIITAISEFSKEIFIGDGTLNHIQHDLGTILIHHATPNIIFALVAYEESIYHRIFLREFARQTIDMIIHLEKNLGPSKKEFVDLRRILDDTLFMKKQ